MTKLIFGIWSPAFCRTRATARVSRATATKRFAGIEDRRPHLVILDIWLQGSRLDGLEVLTIMKRTYPDLPVVIISGHGNIETAVTAIKRGAYDYIEKPFKADRLVLVALRALEASQLKREVKSLKERSVVSAEMIGKSPAINQLKNNIEKAAPTNSRIMLRGASGSGKELAARVLHQKSLRADGPFVVLNAAAMVPDRVEDELFGTEDRTGGPRKVGALEEAHSRNALHRRSRRHADGDARQGLARARRAEVPASRRVAEGVGRRPHHFFDQPRSRSGHPRGPVP